MDSTVDVDAMRHFHMSRYGLPTSARATTYAVPLRGLAVLPAGEEHADEAATQPPRRNNKRLSPSTVENPSKRRRVNDDDDDEEEPEYVVASDGDEDIEPSPERPQPRGYLFPAAPDLNSEAFQANNLRKKHVQRVAPSSSFAYLTARKENGTEIMDPTYITAATQPTDATFSKFMASYSKEQPWAEVIDAYITNTYVRELELNKSPHWQLMKRLNGRLSAADLSASLNLPEMDSRAQRIRETFKREVDDQMRRLGDTERARKLLETERRSLEEQQKLFADPALASVASQSKLSLFNTTEERTGYLESLRRVLSRQHLFLLYGLWRNGKITRALTGFSDEMDVQTAGDKLRARLFEPCIAYLRTRENISEMYIENGVDLVQPTLGPTTRQIDEEVYKDLLTIEKYVESSSGKTDRANYMIDTLYDRLRRVYAAAPNAGAPAAPNDPTEAAFNLNALLEECFKYSESRTALDAFVGNVNLIGTISPVTPAVRQVLGQLSNMAGLPSLTASSTNFMIQLIQTYLDAAVFPPRANTDSKTASSDSMSDAQSYEGRVRAAFEPVMQVLQNTAVDATISQVKLFELATACYYAYYELVRFDVDDLRSAVKQTLGDQKDEIIGRLEPGEHLKTVSWLFGIDDSSALVQSGILSETQRMLACVNSLGLARDTLDFGSRAKQTLTELINMSVYYGLPSVLKGQSQSARFPKQPLFLLFDQSEGIAVGSKAVPAVFDNSMTVQVRSSLFDVSEAIQRTEMDMKGPNPTSRVQVTPILSPDQLEISNGNIKRMIMRLVFGKDIGAKSDASPGREGRKLPWGEEPKTVGTGREVVQQYDVAIAAQYFSAAAWINYTRAQTYVSLKLAPVALVCARDFVRVFFGHIVSVARSIRLKQLAELQQKLQNLEKVTNPLEEIVQLLKDSETRSQIVNAISERLQPRVSGLYVFKDNRCTAFEAAEQWIRRIGSQADMRWSLFSMEGLLHTDPSTDIPNTESSFCSFFLDVVHFEFRNAAASNGALIRTNAMTTQENKLVYQLMQTLFKYIPLNSAEEYRTRVPRMLYEMNSKQVEANSWAQSLYY